MHSLPAVRIDPPTRIVWVTHLPRARLQCAGAAAPPRRDFTCRRRRRRAMEVSFAKSLHLRQLGRQVRAIDSHDLHDAIAYRNHDLSVGVLAEQPRQHATEQPPEEAEFYLLRRTSHVTNPPTARPTASGRRTVGARFGHTPAARSDAGRSTNGPRVPGMGIS